MATRNNKPEDAAGASSQTSSSGLPSYLQAALRLSGSYPLGAPRVEQTQARGINVGSLAGLSTFPKFTDPVPGFMILDYLPTLGISKDVTSALNRAANNEFNAIRSQISGNRSYEPADHMIYRVSVDSMRELYEYVRRIYGIVRVYSATNLYRPRAVLAGLGLDEQDWIDNAADLYQWLQMHRSALLPFPTVPLGNISDRRQVFNRYIFMDGDIDSTQGYIFNQKVFFSYEKVDEGKGLTMRTFPSTFDGFKIMWDQMYTALQGSSDVYTIAADIRRAFADRVVTDLPETDIDYRVEYVKADMALCSIMNASIVNVGFANWSKFRIIDGTAAGKEPGLYCDPGTINIPWELDNAEATTFVPMWNHINSIESDPSPETILNSVRFKPVYTAKLNSGRTNVTVEFESVGTELIVASRIISFSGDMNDYVLDEIYGSRIFQGIQANASDPVKLGSEGVLYMCALMKLANFDWHPPVHFSIQGAYSNFIAGDAVYEDVQNYVPYSNAQVRAITDAMLLREFGF